MTIMRESGSPSLEQRVRLLDRDAPGSLTARLVELFMDAIRSGELQPGAKLPPTRRLAELADINQLTASRCYRRLQILGAVVSEVGRGTFVRSVVPPASGHAPPRADGSWQLYALPA